MRGSRTKDKKKKEVIELKINNPSITLREITEKTGLNRETSSKIIKNILPEVVKNSEVIANLIDNNNNLQSLADKLIAEMIEIKDKTITVAQLTTLRESTFKQNQLLGLKPTDIVSINGYKMLEEIKDGIKGKEDAYALLNKLKEDKE